MHSFLWSGRWCVNVGWYYAAQIPGELWQISGAPPAKPASWLRSCWKKAFQRTCTIHLQPVAVFTSRLLLEKWACMQVAKCASTTHCCLFAPPSVSLNSPLPSFVKAVPVSSTNKRFSSYLCSGPSREDGRWLETEYWHSVGVQTQSAAFVGVALLSTLSCCVNLLHRSFILDLYLYRISSLIDWLIFCWVSFFQSF